MTRWLDNILLYVFVAIGQRYWSKVDVVTSRDGKAVVEMRFMKAKAGDRGQARHYTMKGKKK